MIKLLINESMEPSECKTLQTKLKSIKNLDNSDIDILVEFFNKFLGSFARVYYYGYYYYESQEVDTIEDIIRYLSECNEYPDSIVRGSFKEVDDREIEFQVSIGATPGGPDSSSRDPQVVTNSFRAPR